ncbi:MAG: hypothetical protein A3I07_04105 [Candidatus Doudnabacteria bacterium RIFCSPLOWO2_02_FULL_42_9]|uniref:Uncharacterized protein n=1 Tax=Candidatus Doudnabacteria bacterium RIFCSPHIGHO2_01_FULL_41_86 TaxID=1817821 RepID=A0A1F5N8I1_9BACT|nr:MAG: hypothetical protein A2717_00315 [Candidatus Doudnabacteria bacterium RIFCSPHIGHO2_01_FULL_41_86]OGE75182.1 MAG: hypothetical protein A3K07_01735 [Candidatus Doudnabacteria bacterium RIFCSPHIGHO2_01_43_10]OGE86393.1 MAG: hypothetical protein A3E28_00190 [Candidatus Doudnabacteria bacterium RIFCSPHIGHO2_12_FULL_42_22]OGE87392.1 MAG: hypothetical protein A3C49_04175 [Candidatus Doudnabacteria bacterium RIFCSPHIGHO2_02_FULL_42_25]OGE92690.1 MAG: hypothetical protein A2895_03670 [Candidatus
MARNDKHLALLLRKSGKSYGFISRELQIPKSTLSEWFSGLKWSGIVKNKLITKANLLAQKRMRLMAKANQKRWLDWRAGYRLQAIEEFELLKNNPLFISGVMLYWAEGDNGKKSSNVRLANIDPRMIRIFIKFALKICKVSKANIRIGLILYPDLKDTVCKSFWSKYLKIPIVQFHKTQVIKGNHPTKRLEYGICMVRIGGAGLKEKIKVWIDLCSKEIMRV